MSELWRLLRLLFDVVRCVVSKTRSVGVNVVGAQCPYGCACVCYSVCLWMSTRGRWMSVLWMGERVREEGRGELISNQFTYPFAR